MLEDEKILKFSCILDRIFYPKYKQKIESGEYGICSVFVTKWFENEIDSQTIKLKGICPNVEYGTPYKVFCKLAEHNEMYGDTYDIIYMNKYIDISSKDKQKTFLQNVCNVTLVDRLFEMYDDVLTLLDEENIEALCKVKGIGNQVALRLIDEYKEAKDYSSIYMELGELGLTHVFIKKLTDFYKSPDVVIDKIRNDPYDLVQIDGIGFKKADDIARRVGVGQYDVARIKAFLLHYMKEQGECGKSYLTYQDLMKNLYDTLGYVPEDVINSVAKMMIDDKSVVVFENGNKIALRKFYELEKTIKDELIRLQVGLVEIKENQKDNCHNEKESDTKKESQVVNKDYVPKRFNIENIEKVIKDVEDEQGFEFTEEQTSAIELSLNNNVIALTGGAGCGKTSTAKGICTIYKNANIVACALSGKASVRITEATGIEAGTIHRTLGWMPKQGFTFNRENKLVADIVLIDEATMINGTLFESLLEAIPTRAKVIIMGDVQQLTPIGNCQVFADILDSEVLPTVKLTKPHRQALRSGIIPTSIKVAHREQIFPDGFSGNQILGELQDMELDISSSKESFKDCIVRHFQSEMEKWNDIMEVQICVPMRLRGSISCYELNNTIQNIYNPKLKDENEIEILLEKKNDEIKKYNIRKGDKIINTKNNYKCVNMDGNITPVFNGNMGIVKDISDKGECTIDFIGIGTVIFTGADKKNLELGYACTIHKLQGSGFLSTIMGMDSSSYIMNNSELLYTGITRAKKYCVLVGNNVAIKTAIKRKETNVKQTFLKDLLLESVNKLKEDESYYNEMEEIY